MSMWLCPEHGLIGPGSCCAKACRTEFVDALPPLDHEAYMVALEWSLARKPRRVDKIAARDAVAEAGWICVARRSHGICHTRNDMQDETCGACGNDRA